METISVTDESIPFWRRAGHRYYPLGLSMRHRFGHHIGKVSVDAGFSCPNVDGTIGHAGCVFCNNASFSPSRCPDLPPDMVIGEPPPLKPIFEQIETGIRNLRYRYAKAEKFIAYFQPSTNTHAPPLVLERVFEEALKHPDIVGLAIGTRPDSVPEPVLDILEALASRTEVQLEIGLQSIHEKSLKFLRRGHDYGAFEDAFSRCRGRGLRLGVHLIIGLPDEDRTDILATADAMVYWHPNSIKLHNLYVVRDTPLAEQWSSGSVRLPSLSEYAALVVDFLERIPPDIVVERISGEASGDYLLAPDWAARKHAARNAIDEEFRKRQSFQGKFWSVCRLKTIKDFSSRFVF